MEREKMSTGKAWSKVHDAMLVEMWLTGAKSGTIGRVIGRSRDAVMGRINRCGLMKKQRTGMFGTCDLEIVRTAVESGMLDFAKEYDGENYRQVFRIVLAMVADGRNSKRLVEITGSDASAIDVVSDALNASKLWPENGGPPEMWWAEGKTVVRADIMHLSNSVLIERQANAA